MPDSPEIDVPETLDRGRYRVQRVIGVGGSATVLLAHDTRMGVDRAIKILHPNAARSIQNRERFRAEAQAQAGLKHPNVLMVHDAIEDAQGVYLVMELAESDSVGHRIHEEGPLPVEDVIQIGITIGRALAVAHKAGLVHRDVKPANILLDRHGTYKLADFGIARAADRDVNLTRTGMVMGTWAYMPPEQREDSREVDPRSDIYAFGVTLYVLATGKISQSLHNREAWAEAYAGMPQALAVIIQQATRLFPEDRYATMEDLVADLERLADALEQNDIETPVMEAPAVGIDDRSTLMPDGFLSVGSDASNPTLYPAAAEPPVEVERRPRRYFGLLVATAAVALLGVAGGAALLIPRLLSIEPTQEAAPPGSAPEVASPRVAEPSETPQPAVDPVEPAAVADATPAASPKPASPRDVPPAETRGPRIISVIPGATATSAPSTAVNEAAAPDDVTGTVVVRTVPSGATVRLGKRVLTPGASGGFELPIGSHTLDLQSMSGETYRLPVSVKAGQTVEVCYSFDTNSACAGSP